MISYIHRNTKMVLSFNRDLKPTFKQAFFIRDLGLNLGFYGTCRFDQRNLKPSGAEETKMTLSKAKARNGNRFLKPPCPLYDSHLQKVTSVLGDEEIQEVMIRLDALMIQIHQEVNFLNGP
ncbi:hypothetical protein Hanom_Chr15g01344201 [Helianthus anomalus]